MRLTFRYRIKDKHARRLNEQARAVNFVWNYCNEVQRLALKRNLKWPTGYDLWKLAAGCTKAGLDLHSHSAMRVCLQYASTTSTAMAALALETFAWLDTVQHWARTISRQ